MKRATLHGVTGALHRASLTTPKSKGAPGPRASSMMSPFRSGGPTRQAGQAAMRAAGLSGRYRPVAASRPPEPGALPPRKKPSWMTEGGPLSGNGRGSRSPQRRGQAARPSRGGKQRRRGGGPQR
jgi:hypothetical protein